jgi:hypothetical protein
MDEILNCTSIGPDSRAGLAYGHCLHLQRAPGNRGPAQNGHEPRPISYRGTSDHKDSDSLHWLFRGLNLNSFLVDCI